MQPTPPPLSPTRIRGIVFDLDGTLVDSFDAISESLNHARLDSGLPPLTHEEIKAHVGRGLEPLIADLIGPDRVEAGVRAFRAHYAESFADGTRMIPGVRDALRDLDTRGMVMSVASNKPARFGDAICEGLGIRKYFRTVLGPDLVGSTKPEPTMLRRAILEMDVVPSAVVYVGDMLLDIETAAQANVALVLVATGSCSREQLKNSGHITLDQLSELPQLLAG